MARLTTNMASDGVATVNVPVPVLEQLRKALETSLNSTVTIQGLCKLFDDESWETCSDAIYFSSCFPSEYVYDGLEALGKLLPGSDHG